MPKFGSHSAYAGIASHSQAPHAMQDPANSR
eukprot:CAMPEP_0202834438 /NCGR_PEP_ID=MMETSP1389-20130828/32259_1 /ASSEMBLY_ACC=CAM_ASM_000865 /TAXON_ID=302021 /ORGANISM="Rhodomonas sp., Strain CCMP768" /LENGTH=30 /DNA_ID= /DNA_START= /DNA_END= /DNA_ORIENTATION=